MQFVHAIRVVFKTPTPMRTCLVGVAPSHHKTFWTLIHKVPVAPPFSRPSQDFLSIAPRTPQVHLFVVPGYKFVIKSKVITPALFALFSYGASPKPGAKSRAILTVFDMKVSLNSKLRHQKRMKERRCRRERNSVPCI